MEQVREERQTMPEKLVWNVKEAGAALGLSPWTIRRYIATGKLTAVRLNRRVFVEPAECERLIRESRTPVWKVRTEGLGRTEEKGEQCQPQ